MRRLNIPFVPVLSLLCLVGCGFSPGPAAGASSDVASGTGAASGTAGVSGTGTGLATGNNEFGGNSGTGGSMSCGQANVAIMPLPPDILIVQDRSGSMDDDQNDATCNGGCGASSKWALVTAAINQVVAATDTTVNWGLKFFADMNAQCGVNPGVAVDVAAGSSAAVATAISGSTKANGGVNNGSYTPTRAAVAAASAYLKTVTDTNSKYILLATDGLPNCPEGCSGNSCTNTPNAAETTAVESAITDAQTAGFKTFVVGIATSSDPDANTALNGFAMAGGEPQTGGTTSYYSVNNTASLVTALNQIVGIVASCTIPLTNVPANLTNVAVSATDANGNIVVVKQDDPNGWSYDDPTTKANIILNGTACTNTQSGAYSNFQFFFSCGTGPICIDKNVDGTCNLTN
jgi:hypothetical protein